MGWAIRLFNAVNDTITADDANQTVPREILVSKHAASTPRNGVSFEAPISNRKIREVLGFREEHDWRKYV